LVGREKASKKNSKREKGAERNLLDAKSSPQPRPSKSDEPNEKGVAELNRIQKGKPSPHQRKKHLSRERKKKTSTVPGPPEREGGDHLMGSVQKKRPTEEKARRGKA